MNIGVRYWKFEVRLKNSIGFVLWDVNTFVFIWYIRDGPRIAWALGGIVLGLYR
jgi:hypothetical protein